MLKTPLLDATLGTQGNKAHGPTPIQQLGLQLQMGWVELIILWFRSLYIGLGSSHNGPVALKIFTYISVKLLVYAIFSHWIEGIIQWICHFR